MAMVMIDFWSLGVTLQLRISLDKTGLTKSNSQSNSTMPNRQKLASTLKQGETGVIDGFSNEGLSLKLLEMGLLPGSEITLVRSAPMGDPLYFHVAGYNLSLRKDEASTVLLR